MTDQIWMVVILKVFALILLLMWPSLLKLDNFIGFMNTPILKASKVNKVINFYNNGEYEEWKKKNNAGKGYKLNIKGLGTSTSKELKNISKIRN